MQTNFIEELRWRGMLHDMMPGTEEQLSKEITAAYIGFDPTAASLHIGNLATIMLLKHFQLCGHKPFALVGGATGMIGDPSGKAAEREFLSEETLRFNQDSIKKQLEKFLDFNAGENSAEMVNNYDWFKEFSFLDFLREGGKYLSVNYMMSKDSVKKRLETGISFTEFSYQLLQGYDFYWLYKNKNVRLQMGGSDQWGNITTGTEIIRRKEGGADEIEHKAFALTTPLVTKADGTKFGKSESGNVWLDPAMTTPYQFYQFWLNTADSDCPRLLRVFTLYNQQTIEALEAEHAEAPHLRIMQKALAKDVTTRVHSEKDYQIVKQASELLFDKNVIEQFEQVDAQVVEALDLIKVKKDDYSNCANITDFLATLILDEKGEPIIFKSKGETRKAIQANSVSINKQKVTDPNKTLEFTLLRGNYLIVNHGKQKVYIIQLV
ncbi:tyrosyl-tRNA synthetase [Arcicella aurantiaca]|uniref:Tyrosine--tRNA ligase n=1 Tax=Arcicella aurantiaca TaxID=591202 RepID=A0A316DUZ9_9BACT|nr:tyrosine--tRNA ligase [Arcicella aurantiaca]PWK22157.1 tyrosyl-tRNA synthetase [Arcicella aurantiaca]